MQSRFLLDIVVTQGTSIFQLFSSEDQTLLVWWDALLILDLSFHIIDAVGCLNIQGDGLAREGLDEDLHPCASRCGGLAAGVTPRRRAALGLRAGWGADEGRPGEAAAIGSSRARHCAADGITASERDALGGDEPPAHAARAVDGGRDDKGGERDKGGRDQPREQKTREDSENSLIRVLEDMCQKMQWLVSANTDSSANNLS